MLRRCAGMSRIAAGVHIWLLLASCSAGSVPDEDLGPLLPRQDGTGSDILVQTDAPVTWTHLCRANEGGNPSLLLIAGQAFEISLTNQNPGEVVPGLHFDFFDFCHEKFAAAESGPDGTFVFQMEVGENGFDGYVEYTKEGYPLFRQFDKRFQGPVVATKFRLAAGLLFDGPLLILGQESNLGFIQGSAYNLVSEKPIPGVKVTSTSGFVAYLSDTLPVPDKTLPYSQSQGVFFVYNVQPGEVELTAHLPDGRQFVRPVFVWPLNSHPRRTITQVGIPVYPEAPL